MQTNARRELEPRPHVDAILVLSQREEPRLLVREERLRPLNRPEGRVDDACRREVDLDETCAQPLDRLHRVVEGHLNSRREFDELEVGTDADGEADAAQLEQALEIAERPVL